MNSKDIRAALLVAKRATGGVVLGDQRQANLSKFLEGNHPLVPPVLYHGTKSDFNKFHHLSHFGDSETSDHFVGRSGSSKMPVHISMKNPLYLGPEEGEADSGWYIDDTDVISHAAKVIGNNGDKLNSSKLSDICQKYREWISDQYDDPEVDETDPSQLKNDKIAKEASDAIKVAGYDGLIYENTQEGPNGSLSLGGPNNQYAKPNLSYIALHPNQVKSALGNNGQFDPTSKDITKATGGAVTDNDNFKSWFGDSVTHTNGMPHVFYTGTSKDKDFNSFNVGRHGAWFTQDPEVASQYAESNDSQGYKRVGWNVVKTNTASRVIPAYIKAEKPYTGELPTEAFSDNYKNSQSVWFDKLRAQGYDSWIPASSGGKLAVVLKEPHQIKSLYNSGSFDSKQKHMNKANGGALTGDMPDTPQRNINSVGLYSKAAEIARGLQQPNGTTQQYMAHLAKQGVKPAEFENAGVPNSPKISREDLASHFDRAVPNIGVTRLSQSDWQKQGSEFTQQQRDRYDHLSERFNRGEGNLSDSEMDELSHLSQLEEDNFNDLFNPQRGNTDNTRYHKYKSEFGGDNYREHLLTLPETGPASDENSNNYHSSHWEQPNVLAHVRMQDAPGQPEQETISDLREKAGKQNWSEDEFQKAIKEKSPKTLHVDEIQSDWAQDGRKNGFRTPDYEKNINELEMRKDIASARHIEIAQRLFDEGLSYDQMMAHPEHESALKDYEHSSDELEKATEKRPVSEGPYVKNTGHWVDLALKHVLHEASKGDYDKVQFATGQENADRYDLSTHFKKIVYYPRTRQLECIKKDGDRFGVRMDFNPDGSVNEHNMHDYIGEELTNRLLSSPVIKDEWHTKQTLEGDDLSNGGEGMKSFYDNILPKAAVKLIQQHDPDIKPEKIKGSDGVERFGFSFTPRAKRSIMKGQPAFARGGKVEPTDAQKSAGNYKKKHINFQGLPISIENEKGSTRSGQDEKGNKWSVKMPADYGYVKRTEGADGDHVDVYVGPDESSSNVFVIDQKDHRTGKFDEHKVMLGFDSLRSAIQTYTNGFSDGKAHLRLGNVARLSMKEFKQWLSHHDTKKPIRNQSAIDKALSVAKSAQGAKNGI